jgi:hypothetical protein
MASRISSSDEESLGAVPSGGSPPDRALVTPRVVAPRVDQQDTIGHLYDTSEDKLLFGTDGHLCWGECTKCMKWRVVPDVVSETDIPERFECRMLRDAYHNNCLYPEMSEPLYELVLGNTEDLPPPGSLVSLDDHKDEFIPIDYDDEFIPFDGDDDVPLDNIPVQINPHPKRQRAISFDSDLLEEDFARNSTGPIDSEYCSLQDIDDYSARNSTGPISTGPIDMEGLILDPLPNADSSNQANTFDFETQPLLSTRAEDLNGQKDDAAPTQWYVCSMLTTLLS